jgi:hypothetical protein
LAVLELDPSDEDGALVVAARCSAAAIAVASAVDEPWEAATLGAALSCVALAEVELELLVLATGAGGVSTFNGVGAVSRRGAGAAFFGALVDGAAFGFAGALTSGGGLAILRTSSASTRLASATTTGAPAPFVLATCAAGVLVEGCTFAAEGWAGWSSLVMRSSTTAPPITVAAMAPIATPK